jgi:hypothetical protein
MEKVKEATYKSEHSSCLLLKYITNCKKCEFTHEACLRLRKSLPENTSDHYSNINTLPNTNTGFANQVTDKKISIVNKQYKRHIVTPEQIQP